MSRFFPSYAPAWLIGAGSALTYLVALLVSPAGTSVWALPLVAGVAVALPNGALFWFFRRQQRLVRETAIAEVREMMADRVKNQLAVIGMCAPLAQNHEASDVALAGITTSVSEITRVVDGLSSASLGSWQAQYHTAMQNGVIAHA